MSCLLHTHVCVSTGVPLPPTSPSPREMSVCLYTTGGRGGGHQQTYAFLRFDWCTGGWLICVDLDFQTCCQFPAAVMECESSIFQIFGAVFYLQNFTHPSSLPPPPPLLPHVDSLPIQTYIHNTHQRRRGGGGEVVQGHRSACGSPLWDWMEVHVGRKRWGGGGLRGV